MDAERLARLKRKLEALNYDGISEPKLDDLAEKVVPGLMTAHELLVDIHTIHYFDPPRSAVLLLPPLDISRTRQSSY